MVSTAMTKSSGPSSTASTRNPPSPRSASASPIPSSLARVLVVAGFEQQQRWRDPGLGGGCPYRLSSPPGSNAESPIALTALAQRRPEWAARVKRREPGLLMVSVGLAVEDEFVGRQLQSRHVTQWSSSTSKSRRPPCTRSISSLAPPRQHSPDVMPNPETGAVTTTVGRAVGCGAGAARVQGRPSRHEVLDDGTPGP